MKKKKIFLVCCMALLASVGHSQVSTVSLSGKVQHKTQQVALPYVTIVLKKEKDSSFVAGTASNEEGRFLIAGVPTGNYVLDFSYVGFKNIKVPIFVGNLSPFLEIPSVKLEEEAAELGGVTVAAKTAVLSDKLDKKTYTLSEHISQAGGSVLQSMQNLPGIAVSNGKVQLRGNDKVVVLIDGKQTAFTGFGSQAGLDNIPASAIDKIEIINNPSSKYDANGNAGIINIILKKNNQNGWNGKLGLATGVGALWIRKANLPDINPQYTFTPKINPSLAVNYRKEKLNFFVQADHLYTQTLNKNEYVSRYYNDGIQINSQLKRNRDTHFFNSKGGADWYINAQNTFTLSGMFGSEQIIDRGDQPFFDGSMQKRLRLWQFVEDELKTTAMASATYQHQFKEAGHVLNIGFNYTFHREDEQYFYQNDVSNSKGNDAFKLLSDEKVYDLNIDYSKALKYGRVETGVKWRGRRIPTHMQFKPGHLSVLDVNAGGWANYHEWIPALYGNYVFETKNWEAELGLRLEYVKIKYEVNPHHPTYTSDGYQYTEPFPSLRWAYKWDNRHKLSLFYNRRVDRPNEVDTRIFPKYDDAEIIKVGNPALRPQFTNSVELGYKNTWAKGYFYGALYHRFARGTITRISITEPGSTLIYAIFGNAGKSFNTGIELLWQQKVWDGYQFDMNGAVYQNKIDAFAVALLYPQPSVFATGAQRAISGNLKWNHRFKFWKNWDAQLTALYLAPDIMPQGRILNRFSVDGGIKRAIQKGKGSLFLNATDIFNTMAIKRVINGTNFRYSSDNFYENQVFRLGYTYKF